MNGDSNISNADTVYDDVRVGTLQYHAIVDDSKSRSEIPALVVSRDTIALDSSTYAYNGANPANNQRFEFTATHNMNLLLNSNLDFPPIS